MKTESTEAVQIQRRYYENTAARYDSMHAHEGVADTSISSFVHGMMRILDVRSVLDVGTATGRGVRELKTAFPDAFVCGIEPVAGLIKEAAEIGSTLSGPVIRATGEALPFPDASFDAVCEFAILHHAADPNAVVKEMLRVARKAVFLCDSNRFGQGAMPLRFLKLALYKCGLWGAYNYLRTGGKGYLITEGDGLAYSYSVYDSLDLVGRWADRVILIPANTGKSTTWFQPLLSSSGVLVCAIKDSTGE
jgi:ubiquinone/menaquinone biosynthesis C-methylase UbiE